MTLFHPGELYFQKIQGVEKQIADRAPNMISDYLSAQQRDFFSQLKQIFIASVDNSGQPWASILVGPIGFIDVLDARILIINSQAIQFDPLHKNLDTDTDAVLALLGLDFSNRIRNRVAAVLQSNHKNVLELSVRQAFGNCPKYIQARKINSISVNSKQAQVQPKKFEYFDSITKRFISKADTFFIASYYPNRDARSVDISHRGGKPGFIRIENNTLIIEDYPGNNIFMTLGNMHIHSKTGLLFIDFETGDMLQLACQSQVEELVSRPGKTIREVRFHLKYGWFRQAVLSIDSEFINYSPFLDNTF